MTPDQQQLIDYFTKLSDADAHALLRFAAFLAGEPLAPIVTTATAVTPAAAPANPAVQQPNQIARPQQERVVDAIKRLSETYPMLDKKNLLHQTAGLVAEHVMGGKPAKGVIDEIESVFRRAYEQYVAQQRGG